MHVLRQGEFLGNHRCRVMISGDQVNRDLLGLQPDHLSPEEQAGAVVLPVAVIEVARNDHEIDRLVDSQIHEVLKGLAGSPTE